MALCALYAFRSATATSALAPGLTPLLCRGEPERPDSDAAAATVVAQRHADLEGAPAGAVTVAYEPVWAIGAESPASIPHIVRVTRALREALDALPARAGSAMGYGGSAGAGPLPHPSGTVPSPCLAAVAPRPLPCYTVTRC